MGHCKKELSKSVIGETRGYFQNFRASRILSSHVANNQNDPYESRMMLALYPNYQYIVPVVLARCRDRDDRAWTRRYGVVP